MSAQDIPRAVKEAFHIATTGRPGPVLLDIPKDIVDPANPKSLMDWYWPDSVDLPGYRCRWKATSNLSRQAAEMIKRAKRPVFYVGGGVLKARGAEALRALAEMTGIHAVTTLMARGALPDSHPLCLGMPGMHGNYTAITSMQECDLLVCSGCSFRRSRDRQARRFCPARQNHSRRHRSGRDGQGSSPRLRHRWRRARRDGTTHPGFDSCAEPIRTEANGTKQLRSGSATTRLLWHHTKKASRSSRKTLSK